MDAKYKLDIFEKAIQFSAVVYFAFGILYMYSWSCKELDFKTDNYDILIFWETLAGGFSILMLTNVLMIVYYIWKERKHLLISNKSETTVFFYFLWTPAFLVTVAYHILRIYISAHNIETSGGWIVFSNLTELCLICSSAVFIVYLNHRMYSQSTMFENLMKNSLKLLTTVGLANSMILHSASILINTFVECASNSTEYGEFYNRSSRIANETDLKFHHVQGFLPPIAVLFCFISIVHLLIGSGNSIKDDEDLTKLNDTSGGSRESLLQITRTRSSSVRISPLSFIFAVLFCTVTLMLFIVVNTLVQRENLSLIGKLIFAFYPIPIYLLLVVLLIVQIFEMERWPKLVNDNTLIDKILMWIGVTGQIIVSLGQIKFYYHYGKPMIMSIFVRIQYTLLIIEMLFQAVTVSLALDRQWLSPEPESWQARLCPPAIVLSVNIAFLVYSFLVVKSSQFNKNDGFFFANLFEKGFLSVGETLAILQRMHACLIFGKMIIAMHH